MSDLPRFGLLLLAMSAAAASGGCTVARAVATVSPGDVPRDGQLVEASGVGAEQVRFVVRFKVGPDAAPSEGPPPAEATPGEGPAVVRILDTRLVDTTGRSLAVVDQEVRRDGNLYTVSLTSSAASPDSYELVCQAHLLVGAYQVKVAAGAFREVDRWRADPRSFKFSVFSASERSPWWLRELQLE